MNACTFFGHRDAPEEIQPLLEQKIIDLICKGVKIFYVGNQGAFDLMVIKTLEKISAEYSNIAASVVLAYMPKEKSKEMAYGIDTIFPNGLEKTPRKFAIYNRNIWMINNSDYVITYVKYIVGGASAFKEIAERKGKTVISINHS